MEFDVYFHFRLEGNDRLVIKDMALVNYLRQLKDIEQAQVYFNFNDMQCPFDLRVELLQPASDNRFGQLDGPIAQREFFIGWLSRQRLNLSPIDQNRLLNQSATISVPCGVLRLGPVSGGTGSR